MLRPAAPHEDGFLQTTYQRLSQFFYLTVLKLFQPQQRESNLQWHLNGLLREIYTAARGFNYYFPFAKLGIMAGFFFTAYNAFSLSATHLVLMAFWFNPLMSFVAPFFVNLALQTMGIIILPGLYLQGLKLFNLWPMQNRAISFFPRPLYADVKDALRKFDWQISKWLSNALVTFAFPEIYHLYLLLRGERPILPPDTSRWERFKNYWASWNLSAWHKPLIDVKSPSPLKDLTENKALPYLFNIGLQSRLHKLSYVMTHYDELNNLIEEKRQKHITDESQRYLVRLFTPDNLEKKGFFSTLKSAIQKEWQTSRARPR